MILLCRFVPGGRIASGYHAGRDGYPVRSFIGYDGAAALGWAGYGGLVGHLGGTAITQSAWRLFAVAATAAVVFGTAGWILALFGGGNEPRPGRDDTAAGGDQPEAGGDHPAAGAGALAADADDPAAGGDGRTVTGPRAASADGPPPRSTRRARGRS